MEKATNLIEKRKVTRKEGSCSMSSSEDYEPFRAYKPLDKLLMKTEEPSCPLARTDLNVNQQPI
jgi:hypothetical protein